MSWSLIHLIETPHSAVVLRRRQQHSTLRVAHSGPREHFQLCRLCPGHVHGVVDRDCRPTGNARYPRAEADLKPETITPENVSYVGQVLGRKYWCAGRDLDSAIIEVHYILCQEKFESAFENEAAEHEFIAAAVADVQRFVSPPLDIEGRVQPPTFPDPKKTGSNFFNEVKGFLHTERGSAWSKYRP